MSQTFNAHTGILHFVWTAHPSHSMAGKIFIYW